MGMFDGWFGSSNSGSGSSSSSSGGHLDKLDPQLREFLRRESPVKYDPTPPTKGEQQQQPQQPTHRQQLAQKLGTADNVADAQQQQQQQQQQQRDPSAVPQESLFPDGRYAHLWKTYRPLAAIEAETKTDHEKLMDVLDGYKERKSQIGRAALENCALEQLDWSNCMKSGDWTARMTMCRNEVRKFERCYTTQSKLLKALGYLSSYDRSPEVDEDIQMHADKLYNRMLEQEAAIEKAKAEGKAPPQFPSLFEAARAKAASSGMSDLADMSPEMQKKVEEQLSKVPEEERAAEEAAIRAELKAKQEIASQVKGLWQEQAKEREARKAAGKETIGDQVSNLLGWRK